MSVEKRKESNKLDKQDIPDSTTKERCFIEGDEIFVLENDQFVFGEVKEVDTLTEKCLVKFPNGETLWALFKNIKLTKNISQSPLKCCVVCKSTQGRKYNVVIICETCSRGYHQRCHKPVIKCFAEDKWNCSVCSKERNCQLSANIVTQKTVLSTSKDSSLPGSSEDLPFYNSNCGSHPELPPTPPSSVSAPETPQPVAGEPPASPADDATSCVDFDDVSAAGEPTVINLDEIFTHLKEAPKTAADIRGISFPLPLNVVITTAGPLVRTKKRKLSAADFVVVDGQIKYKRRRPRKRCVTSATSSSLSASAPSSASSSSSLLASGKNLKNVESLAASASKLYVGGRIVATAAAAAAAAAAVAAAASTANSASCRTTAAATSRKTTASACIATTTTSTVVDSYRTMTTGGRHCDAAAAAQIRNYTDTDLKSLVRKYYEEENRRLVDHQMDRIALGDEYRICGKRKTFDGRVQYLVEWLKCNRFDI